MAGPHRLNVGHGPPVDRKQTILLNSSPLMDVTTTLLTR